MADPFKLRVLKALTAELATITPANGFINDLTGSVFRGRDIFGHSDPLPMVSILESVDEKTWTDMRPGSAIQGSEWELLVQGWVEDDPKNPTDPAYVLIADVKQKLAQIRMVKGNILGFGAKVDKLKFSAGVVRPADEISDKAYFWLKVQLDVTEDHANPYA